MNPILARDLAEVLGEPTDSFQLAREQRLRSAALLVSHGPDGAITTTTVVGVLGRDDEGQLRALVERIANDYGLEAAVTVKRGSFSARLGRGSAR
jgi:hypothetical protein